MVCVDGAAHQAATAARQAEMESNQTNGNEICLMDGIEGATAQPIQIKLIFSSNSKINLIFIDGSEMKIIL